MGAALWRRVEETPAPIADHWLPAGAAGCRYRIEVFRKPRAPWRRTPAEAMSDAVRLELASWDESEGRHYLAVPVEMRVRYLGLERPR